MKPMLNDESFIKAYDSHADAIFRYFYYRVSSREQAKDLSQETFIRTWQYLVDGKQILNIRAFLYQVARNLMVDFSRKKTTESLEVLQEKGFDPGADTRKQLHTAIDANAALTVLNQLDEKYREVVLMRFVDGLSPKEIAKMVEENENVVSVRIHRGLKQMRALLEKNT